MDDECEAWKIMGSFKKATKSQAKLRMAITGPSGSGKTYTALSVGTPLGNIAVIDTERGSASKYADLFDFDVLELTEYHPRHYIEAIKAACAGGYDVLIIDSLSHAWSGQGGVLELVDRAAKRSQSQNSFAAWRDVTPLHNQLVDTILGAPIHIIATMRSKTEYVLERDERGRTTPRKVGLAPVQRDGMEYEFDVVAEMDMDNNMIISKSRIVALTGGVVNRPDGQFGELLKAWLSDGALAPIQTTERAGRGRYERSTEESVQEPVDTDGLPQTLGELKQLVVVEKKWIKGGEIHWRTMIDLLKKQGVIIDEDDYPAMYLAIEQHYGKKKLRTASGE
jgi:hypothetical protein